jgi:septal ring factor EnvC (AmiA/AmiB activator)
MDHHLRQMRQKMDAVSSYNESQRKEALDFIAHVHELEAQEKRRMEEGRKMIADDFKQVNQQIMDHKKKKKMFKDECKKVDKYNYFPFVAGDLIEQHRASLG